MCHGLTFFLLCEAPLASSCMLMDAHSNSRWPLFRRLAVDFGHYYSIQLSRRTSDQQAEPF
ncbi:transporter arsB [Musa troglodytarum]|uniref:Transporter arsB n=1 Tax=Musa troglodytarum TaxID=320322 RepID=A0A9E7ERR5_9LILI|nr:transporter arsB [Musa troglodytarum]